MLSDGTVRKIGYAYDDLSRVRTVTSFDAGDAVLNQIQREYDGLGRLAGVPGSPEFRGQDTDLE